MSAKLDMTVLYDVWLPIDISVADFGFDLRLTTRIFCNCIIISVLVSSRIVNPSSKLWAKDLFIS